MAAKGALVNRALAGTGFQGSPHAARVCHMANRIQQYRIDLLALCGHKTCKPPVQSLPGMTQLRYMQARPTNH
jgi:hypothetical protein